MECVYVLCAFLIFCVIDVQGLSTHDKSKHLKYSKEFYKQSANPFKDCKDILNTTTCIEYEPFCIKVPKVSSLCKRTCGLCPAVSPMSCHLSRYGCCWDNITTSERFGEGCPACEDKSSGCTKYLDDCHVAHVRRGCPITCRVEYCMEQKNLCFDNPKQSRYCPIFKGSGFCTIEVDLMKEYCSKTCNLCGIGNHINPPREVVKKSLITRLAEFQKKKDFLLKEQQKKDTTFEDLLASESWKEHKKKDTTIADLQAAESWKEHKKKDTTIADLIAAESWKEHKKKDTTIADLIASESSKEHKKKDTTIADLLAAESWIEHKKKISNEQDSKRKISEEERISEIMKELKKRSLINQKKDDVVKTLKAIRSERDEKAAEGQQRIHLKDVVEKDTEELLNDLIEDTISQQHNQKIETRRKKQQADRNGVDDLEAALLDLLLKERSKDKQ